MSAWGLQLAIETITSKVVLILGRFTAHRKPVLDALRTALRAHDYSPILFPPCPWCRCSSTRLVSTARTAGDRCSQRHAALRRRGMPDQRWLGESVAGRTRHRKGEPLLIKPKARRSVLPGQRFLSPPFLGACCTVAEGRATPPCLAACGCFAPVLGATGILAPYLALVLRARGMQCSRWVTRSSAASESA